MAYELTSVDTQEIYRVYKKLTTKYKENKKQLYDWLETLSEKQLTNIHIKRDIRDVWSGYTFIEHSTYMDEYVIAKHNRRIYFYWILGDE